MPRFVCKRLPEGHIRTAAGFVHFHAGVAQVDDPELADALREVPAVFGITEDGTPAAKAGAKSKAEPEPTEREPARPAADTPGADGSGVPDGTAKDVLDWVGDDPDRAQRALAAEQGREKPRSTLVATLTRLAE